MNKGNKALKNIAFIALHAWVGLAYASENANGLILTPNSMAQAQQEQVFVLDNAPVMMRGEPINAAFTLTFFAADIYNRARDLEQSNASSEEYRLLENQALGLAYMAERHLQTNTGNTDELVELRQRMVATALWIQGQRGINF